MMFFFCVCLTKGYEKHAKRLRKTGEGVDSQDDK